MKASCAYQWLWGLIISLAISGLNSAYAEELEHHPPLEDLKPNEAHSEMSGHEGMKNDEGMKGMGTHGDMEMESALGSYPSTRDASGTSWQPEAAPMGGMHLNYDPWMVMIHGRAQFIYTDQGGKRGDDDLFVNNMLMLAAHRPVHNGKIQFRSMLSLEPWTAGDDGYPNLLASGETGDGRTPLIDRQHPHDLFMELSASLSQELSEDSSGFIYFGLPGEPALGPPAFMHRFSGMEIPESPITHHWLDSTHIAFGVGTLGYVHRQLKLEGSVFTGREPDEDRYDIESPEFDSYSGRVTWNFNPNWSVQGSYGDINSPEQLHPEEDTGRTTVSAMHHKKLEMGDVQTTLAWGRNNIDPGPSLDGILLESTLTWMSETIFARVERVEANELFEEGDPLADRIFVVNKITLGGIHDFVQQKIISLGLGIMGTIAILPDDLDEAYGDTPVSGSIFARARF